MEHIMEHIRDWLFSLAKGLHLPMEKTHFSDFGITGDNLPYVFLK